MRGPARRKVDDAIRIPETVGVRALPYPRRVVDDGHLCSLDRRINDAVDPGLFGDEEPADKATGIDVRNHIVQVSRIGGRRHEYVGFALPVLDREGDVWPRNNAPLL